MNKRHFQLLEETLKSGRKKKENIKLKAASVIKSGNVNHIEERTKENLKPLAEREIPREVTYHAKNKETESSIEIIRLGEKIEEIIVYCKCGEVFRVKLDY